MARCRKDVAESPRSGRQSEDTRSRKTSYTPPSRIAHTSYGASIKKWPCGRICPIQTSSISLGFLTLEDGRFSLNGWPTAIPWGMFVTTPGVTLSLQVTTHIPLPLTEHLPARGHLRGTGVSSRCQYCAWRLEGCKPLR